LLKMQVLANELAARANGTSQIVSPVDYELAISQRLTL